MEHPIDAILESRERRVAAATRASVLGSLTVHLVIVGAFAVAPLVAAGESAPMPEFVPVYVVPAQALGVREPSPVPRPPEPAPPERDEPEEPEPEPVLAPPEPPRRQRPRPETDREEPASPPSPAPRDPGALGRRRGSPTGSSTGTAPFGGASIDLADQNFVYGYYVDQMLALIGSNWDRPALGASVRAAVFFRIHKDGRVTDVRIVESSGFNVFDLAGLRAVRLAAPFPRLPESYPRNVLAVKLYLE